MRAEATPVPIPNTTVKIRAADGTMLETAWESRRLPDILIYAHERARYIAAPQHAFGAAQTLKNVCEHEHAFACDEHPGSIS